jgi:hypothetical protein
LDAKEAKEIIRAGFAWANWTDEQKEAFQLAYEAIDKAELLNAEKKLLQSKWEAQGLMIQKLHEENSKYEETIRIYKVSDELVKEQSKQVKHLFPLENTVGYGQLCDKVLELSEDKSFFVKAYTEKIMKED